MMLITHVNPRKNNVLCKPWVYGSDEDEDEVKKIGTSSAKVQKYLKYLWMPLQTEQGGKNYNILVIIFSYT